MSAVAPRSPARTVGLHVLEVLPAFVLAVLLLPSIIQYGSLNPWHPSTIDLDVYRYAVQDMLAGRDIYATRSPFWNLAFIYPPIAAVLMVPLVLGPFVGWQLIWTLGGVAAQQAVLRRCGVRRGWLLALVGVVAVLAVEPIRTTLGYGQVNTMLMFLVVADLLPDAEGERRFLPRGTLIGLAAAIKLTPALFLVFAFLAGRRRLALVGVASFVGFTLIGAIAQPRPSIVFWTGLAGGDTRTAGPIYVGNQSLLGVVARLFGDSRALTLAGLALSAVVALLAALVAVGWWRRGHRAFAVGLVGLGTLLASPLSWTHHHVWVLPLAAGVLIGTAGLPRWAVWVGRIWVLWVSLCLPLALLPYGGDPERAYGPLQELVANLGPLLGVVLIVGLALGLRRTD